MAGVVPASCLAPLFKYGHLNRLRHDLPNRSYARLSAIRVGHPLPCHVIGRSMRNRGK